MANSLAELADYPSSHVCMIFAPDNAPACVAALLNDISDAATGKTIPQILELASSRLQSTDQDGDQQMLDSQEFEDFDVENSESEDDDEYFPGDEDMHPRTLHIGRMSKMPQLALCCLVVVDSPHTLPSTRQLVQTGV